MLHGTRTSMLVGFASAIIGTVLTVVIGAWAGFSGGFVDRFLNGTILVFGNFPTFALLFIVAAAFQNANWLLVSIVIGGIEWAGGARQIRAQTMSLRGPRFHHRPAHRRRVPRAGSSSSRSCPICSVSSPRCSSA